MEKYYIATYRLSYRHDKDTFRTILCVDHPFLFLKELESGPGAIDTWDPEYPISIMFYTEITKEEFDKFFQAQKNVYNMRKMAFPQSSVIRLKSKKEPL